MCSRKLSFMHRLKGGEELARELSLESAEGEQWKAQMKVLIAGWNLVPFSLLLLAGYRLMCFIQVLERAQVLREEASTLFQPCDNNCTITAVHHTIRVMDNRGLTDCGGSSNSNVSLRIGAGN